MPHGPNGARARRRRQAGLAPGGPRGRPIAGLAQTPPERHGWEHEIWSGAEPTLLENVRFLAAYRHRGVVPDADVERAWREVVDGEEPALAERRLARDREPEAARPADGPAVVR